MSARRRADLIETDVVQRIGTYAVARDTRRPHAGSRTGVTRKEVADEISLSGARRPRDDRARGHSDRGADVRDHGGSPDGDGHPNVGLIVFYDATGRYRCCATLVSPTVLLTAAHCTEGTLGSTLVTFESVIAEKPPAGSRTPRTPASVTRPRPPPPGTSPARRTPTRTTPTSPTSRTGTTSASSCSTAGHRHRAGAVAPIDYLDAYRSPC